MGCNELLKNVHGIQNPRHTCWVNATAQMLAHTLPPAIKAALLSIDLEAVNVSLRLAYIRPFQHVLPLHGCLPLLCGYQIWDSLAPMHPNQLSAIWVKMHAQTPGITSGRCKPTSYAREGL